MEGGITMEYYEDDGFAITMISIKDIREKMYTGRLLEDDGMGRTFTTRRKILHDIEEDENARSK